MINSLTIAKVATFGPAREDLTDLRQFNYIFGSNGTGKTTISRIIANTLSTPDCSVAWKDGRHLEALVLNRDFADKNFSQLRGVFTLGEKQKDTLEKITAAKESLDKESKGLASLKKSLEGDDGTGGKQGELAQLELDFQEKCWAQKQKHDAKLQAAFTGYRNNAQNFKQKVLQEAASNSANLKPLADLEARAATIFGTTPTKEAAILMLAPEALRSHESNSILKKKVLGKDDVDIAAMIKKLGNSDWVRQGLPYYEANDQICPFCQQETTDNFAASLKEYFDETFEQDSKAISTLVKEYTADADTIKSNVENIIKAPGKFLNVEEMKSQKALLDQRIRTNQQYLSQKMKEPSRVIELESIDASLTSIKKLIEDANAEVTKHNRTVANLAAEKKALTNEVWQFVLSELNVDYKQYGSKKESLEKAIAGINGNMTQVKDRIRDKEREIRDLEKQTTSIQPTINAINDILLRFGFDSFKLAVADDGKHYKLVRQNGDDARMTLSEGESTFVVFLYFYHLLKGSIAESGITTDRVVVFDDPVSSLDSDILFMVSSLIKDVCENARTGTGHIKQVFVMTHNVYFHKEVTYNKNRPPDRSLNEESFWIVRKCGKHSQLERYALNPIKTSYELLWMELRNAKPANPWIENTLRRILEHYFTILGSIDRDEICGKFDGQDKVLCKSLFSWVNAGSHSALDDAHITPSDAMTQSYLRVFKAVFEKTGHIAHYEMMMRDANPETNKAEPSEEADATRVDQVMRAALTA